MLFNCRWPMCIGGNLLVVVYFQAGGVCLHRGGMHPDSRGGHGAGSALSTS